MTKITGRQSKIGFDVKAAASFGTATACTKLIAVENFAGPLNPGRLVSSPIGRDESMYTSIERGAIDPQANFTSKVGFNNGIPEILATFFGTAGAPTEQNAGQGDYLHVIKFNTTRQAYILTMAEVITSSELREYRDVIVNSVGLSFAGPFPNFVLATIGANASIRIDAAGSQVNTYAGVTALSAPARDEIKMAPTSYFRINADGGGALANGDKKAITGIEIQYTDPLEIVSEVNGTAGNSQPNNSDLFVGTMTVSFASLADFTYFTAAEAGTTYKADILIEGAQIGSGAKYKFQPCFPLLKIVDDPAFTLQRAGVNPYTVTFDMLVRSANPTGMADKYPFINVINTLSTSLLA